MRRTFVQIIVFAVAKSTLVSQLVGLSWLAWAWWKTKHRVRKCTNFECWEEQKSWSETAQRKGTGTKWEEKIKNSLEIGSGVKINRKLYFFQEPLTNQQFGTWENIVNLPEYFSQGEQMFLYFVISLQDNIILSKHTELLDHNIVFYIYIQIQCSSKKKYYSNRQIVFC